MTIDYPDWSVPQTNANAIAGTGAPPLRLTNNLGFSIGTVVNAAITTQIINQAVLNQPGYELSMTIYMNGTSVTSPFVGVTIQWIDSSLGLNTDIEEFFAWAGHDNAQQVQTYVAGPVRGDKLNVFLTNTDPTTSVTVIWTINATSHTYFHERLFQSAYPLTPPVGFNLPGGSPMAGLLYQSSVTVNAASTTQKLCATWNGRVRISIDNNGGANAGIVSFVDPASLYSGTGNSMHTINFGAHAVASDEWVMPNGPVNLHITNSGTSGTINPTITLIKGEY